jgi:phage shock protein PspC (stress-responsive transcriptional regulator)
MSSKSGKLFRSRNRWLGGVCGGLAEWLGWSPTLVRILYLLLSVISAAFPGILVYLVLWFVMPDPGSD